MTPESATCASPMTSLLKRVMKPCRICAASFWKHSCCTAGARRIAMAESCWHAHTQQLERVLCLPETALHVSSRLSSACGGPGGGGGGRGGGGGEGCFYQVQTDADLADPRREQQSRRWRGPCRDQPTAAASWPRLLRAPAWLQALQMDLLHIRRGFISKRPKFQRQSSPNDSRDSTQMPEKERSATCQCILPQGPLPQTCFFFLAAGTPNEPVSSCCTDNGQRHVEWHQ